jgi:hypothetical protein
MYTKLVLFLHLTYLITTSAQPGNIGPGNIEGRPSNCEFNSEFPHVAPPTWQGCIELLHDTPDVDKPETIPTMIRWPMVWSNRECTLILKPSIQPLAPTLGKSINWPQLNNFTMALISRCFGQTRPSHVGIVLLLEFLNRNNCFNGNVNLAILVMGTKYDSLTSGNSGYTESANRPSHDHSPAQSSRAAPYVPTTEEKRKFRNVMSPLLAKGRQHIPLYTVPEVPEINRKAEDHSESLSDESVD